MTDATLAHALLAVLAAAAPRTIVSLDDVVDGRPVFAPVVIRHQLALADACREACAVAGAAGQEWHTSTAVVDRLHRAGLVHADKRGGRVGTVRLTPAGLALLAA